MATDSPVEAPSGDEGPEPSRRGRYLGLPLGPTLVTVVSVLICLGAGGVGVPAYYSSRRVVDDMWHDLSMHISHGTVQQTIRFLEPAVPYTRMTERLVESGRLDPQDEMAMLSHFRAAVEANPNFTWASYAREDGTYLAAYRNEREEILATWRGPAPLEADPLEADSLGADPLEADSLEADSLEADSLEATESSGHPHAVELPSAPASGSPGQRGHAPPHNEASDHEPPTGGVAPADGREIGPTRWREFRPGPSAGTWLTTRDDRGDYDPRTRPWYAEATSSASATWVSPFLFFTRRQPGFMYTSPHRPADHLEGVFAVEYEISHLSEFLGRFRVGHHGRVYIVTHDGLVVGHPAGLVTEGEGDELRIAHAETHPDPLLSGAWHALTHRPPRNVAGDPREGSFRFRGNLGMVERFPAESGIPWLVIVAAPEADFFGKVREQAWTAAGVALALLLIAVLVGIAASRSISRALRRIAEELNRVGKFELSEEGLGVRSTIREVNEMALVTDRMKRSLRSFGRYVPRELVRELMESGQEAVLGGRKRELSILFSDIAGFTSVSERLSPDELVEALGEYLELMGEAIHAHDGTVDKFIGDAIMAFWGAPAERRDHAEAACRAALAMRAKLDAVRGEWEAEGRPTFHTRIGVNTGTVIVGNIGSPERMNYTVIGDPVNLASRLEGLNKSYGTVVLCGETTARQVARRLLVRPLDWVAVKGKARAELVHEVISELDEATDAQREGVAKYTEALDRYRARDFAGAAEAFDEANRVLGGDDGPSRVLADRCGAYERDAPPEGWDGAVVATEK